MAFAPLAFTAAVPRITARSGARAGGARNSGPDGIGHDLAQDPVERALRLSVERPADDLVERSSCSGFRAPHSAMETPGSSRTHRHGECEDTLAVSLAREPLERATAARYCEYRGWRNFGSLRRMSSPRKSVSGFMRPESRPAQSAPYVRVAMSCAGNTEALPPRLPFEQVVGRLRVWRGATWRNASICSGK